MTESRPTDEPDAQRQTPRPATVLVVDDEPSICWAFERMLSEQGHTVITASSAEEGLRLAADRRPDLVLLDVRLPKEDGISALPKFIETSGGSPVIVMTAFGDLETAVAAVHRGASEYLVKPFNLDDARRVCQVALSTSRQSSAPVAVVRKDQGDNRLVGSSPAMQQAFRQIALVAASDLSVLITGETGTGKELVGAAIHRHSHRSKQVYLPIAPVALNEDLVESELFGHVKGAFTGADADRSGLFDRAEGGTVFLDEIGDLPMSVQVKLLRVLDQGEYLRVGDVRPRRCNVRVLAATNRDLHEAMRQGQFREDLYYRLSGLHIHLPPLRERLEDLAVLCRHFLRRLGNESAAESLSDELIDALSKRPWHGNVRELNHAVEHAAVVARGRSLTIDDFPPAQLGRDSAAVQPPEASLADAVAAWCKPRLEVDAGEKATMGLHADLIAAIEPTLLRLTLQATAGSRAAAAERLGIHRGTLREKLRHYGINDVDASGGK
ncbi:sigma-54-dependent transcriptional regulator [Rhodopirellula sp. JC639]|uniref:sigma-54-dependent transcriptional regulator n=1 Tax=Stieleria mannarensis TaxID=2755585 RepID=UPI0016034805|nr:sigma-54 dependent transcriptional regulator [Rhodopirellula sp. JC639]